MGEALILRLINVDIISHHVISDRIRTILAILKKKNAFINFRVVCTWFHVAARKIFILEAIYYGIINQHNISG